MLFLNPEATNNSTLDGMFNTKYIKNILPNAPKRITRETLGFKISDVDIRI